MAAALVYILTQASSLKFVPWSVDIQSFLDVCIQMKRKIALRLSTSNPIKLSKS